jgi:hypothetical protein
MEHQIQSFEDQVKAVSCKTKAKSQRRWDEEVTLEYPEEQGHPHHLQEIFPQEIYPQEIYSQGICRCSRCTQQ